MKKSLSPLFAVVVALSIAACGEKKDTTPPVEQPAPEPAPVVAAEPTPEPEKPAEPALAPNVQLMHLPGGPAVAAFDVGFVRVAAGTPFPPHRHVGDEHVLVLQGSYRDSTGPTVRPGDQVHMPTGTEHHFIAAPERDLIYAVVVGGIEIGGLPVGIPRAPTP